MAKDLRESALDYHRQPTPGKLSVQPTKPLATQRDLALAYSPGVAAACDAILADPGEAAQVTARGNLVAVITNGTAVLGLGDIGPLAAKPVMEGKAVLFKKFAGIDVFDIEIQEKNPDKLVDIIAALEPTFGGINLEDIKAPECFAIEQALRERLSIPVFHDDQHGTAIIVAAAIVNGLKVVGKRIEEIKLAVSGAGAAALACLDLLLRLGMPRENIWVTDIAGVVYRGRTELMDPHKARYAQDTGARSLREIIAGADIFLGLSAGGVLKPDMVTAMASRPLILALANPIPEIMPEEAKAVRPDAIIATGRSDYPNQVNNVLCFPFIFRGALDVGATAINEEMKIACVHALANLATAESSEIVTEAYGCEAPPFGPDYLIPRPFDPRLILQLAPAVAKAAMESGLATRPIIDFHRYRQQLTEFVFRSGIVMKPLFMSAKQVRKRVIYAEGEDERVLRAAQTVVDEEIAEPILVGDADTIIRKAARLGIRLRIGKDVRIVPCPDPAGATAGPVRTAFAASLMRKQEGDAMLCGTSGIYAKHLQAIETVIGRAPGVTNLAALHVLLLPHGTLFLADTQINPDPSPAQLADIALMAADEVRRFGVTPKLALLSHSTFGSSNAASAEKMRQALQLIRTKAPHLKADGEMRGEYAMSEELRNRLGLKVVFEGQANLLVFPNLDAASLAFGLLRELGSALAIGPILLGLAEPAHVLLPFVSARGLVNMTAVAAVGAQGKTLDPMIPVRHGLPAGE